MRGPIEINDHLLFLFRPRGRVRRSLSLSMPARRNAPIFFTEHPSPSPLPRPPINGTRSLSGNFSKSNPGHPGEESIKAAIFHEFGGPEVIKIEDVPEPGPGLVLVRINDFKNPAIPDLQFAEKDVADMRRAVLLRQFCA